MNRNPTHRARQVHPSKSPTIRSRILELLQVKPMTVPGLADALNVKYQSAQINVNALLDDGLIRRNGFSPKPRPAVLFEVVA